MHKTLFTSFQLFLSLLIIFNFGFASQDSPGKELKALVQGGDDRIDIVKKYYMKPTDSEGDIVHYADEKTKHQYPFDLGQSSSLIALEELVKKEFPKNKLFLSGFNLATPVVIHYVAQLCEQKKEADVGGVLLEFPIYSENEVLAGTVAMLYDTLFSSGALRNALTYMPFSRITVLVLAKLLSPLFFGTGLRYNPLWGRSVAASLKKIKDVTFPIFIITKHPEETVFDSKEKMVYAELKKQNEHVYLFEGKKSSAYVSNGSDESAKFRRLELNDELVFYALHKKFLLDTLLDPIKFKSHADMSAQVEFDDFKKYQPNPEDVLKQIDPAAIKKRRWRNIIDFIATLCIVSLIVKKYIPFNFKK